MDSDESDVIQERAPRKTFAQPTNEERVREQSTGEHDQPDYPISSVIKTVKVKYLKSPVGTFQFPKGDLEFQPRVVLTSDLVDAAQTQEEKERIEGYSAAALAAALEQAEAAALAAREGMAERKTSEDDPSSEDFESQLTGAEKRELEESKEEVTERGLRSEIQGKDSTAAPKDRPSPVEPTQTPQARGAPGKLTGLQRELRELLDSGPQQTTRTLAATRAAQAKRNEREQLQRLERERREHAVTKEVVQIDITQEEDMDVTSGESAGDAAPPVREAAPSDVTVEEGEISGSEVETTPTGNLKGYRIPKTPAPEEGGLHRDIKPRDTTPRGRPGTGRSAYSRFSRFRRSIDSEQALRSGGDPNRTPRAHDRKSPEPERSSASRRHRPTSSRRRSKEETEGYHRHTISSKSKAKESPVLPASSSKNPPERKKKDKPRKKKEDWESAIRKKPMSRWTVEEWGRINEQFRELQRQFPRPVPPAPLLPTEEKLTEDAWKKVLRDDWQCGKVHPNDVEAMLRFPHPNVSLKMGTNTFTVAAGCGDRALNDDPHPVCAAGQLLAQGGLCCTGNHDLCAIGIADRARRPSKLKSWTSLRHALVWETTKDGRPVIVGTVGADPKDNQSPRVKLSYALIRGFEALRPAVFAWNKLLPAHRAIKRAAQARVAAETTAREDRAKGEIRVVNFGFQAYWLWTVEVHSRHWRALGPTCDIATRVQYAVDEAGEFNVTETFTEDRMEEVFGRRLVLDCLDLCRENTRKKKQELAGFERAIEQYSKRTSGAGVQTALSDMRAASEKLREEIAETTLQIPESAGPEMRKCIFNLHEAKLVALVAQNIPSEEQKTPEPSELKVPLGDNLSPEDEGDLGVFSETGDATATDACDRWPETEEDDAQEEIELGGSATEQQSRIPSRQDDLQMTLASSKPGKRESSFGVNPGKELRSAEAAGTLLGQLEQEVGKQQPDPSASLVREAARRMRELLEENGRLRRRNQNLLPAVRTSSSSTYRRANVNLTNPPRFDDDPIKPLQQLSEVELDPRYPIRAGDPSTVHPEVTRALEEVDAEVREGISRLDVPLEDPTSYLELVSDSRQAHPQNPARAAVLPLPQQHIPHTPDFLGPSSTLQTTAGALGGQELVAKIAVNDLGCLLETSDNASRLFEHL